MRAVFTFQPPKTEAENLKLFFERFGGYTAFVKTALTQNGYKPLPDIKEVSKRVRSANIKDYAQFNGADGENLD